MRWQRVSLWSEHGEQNERAFDFFVFAVEGDGGAAMSSVARALEVG
jgi:hypothetical protein